ncbi:Uncharacterised protein [Mycobacterium tuberculosis]|uniref:Uncharacterized protein n=1 Tax=Mycobacterium tuberculosis TaxID=1773 RepID=A0A0T9D7Q7_MYCTX|nr:Uncharacterised protein [Mycobacterium tuberculosis]CFR96694.1 Uncharacterised protein [Mycobacterium tuberculosis]CKP87239.1 Uncharacterised protein [Mycobacterium tuberculosis]CKQ25363.1 Uncharacterised protein [Mycobacterium tuberculosis]CKQ85994.1 Uncharacterised protein [Mycobacterium tuberculosis]
MPRVRVTELSAVNCTRTVASGLMEILVTLPTSTPAMRTSLPVRRLDTLANSA